MEQQAANALSYLTTKGEEEKTPGNKDLVLTVFQVYLACAPQKEISDFDFIEEPEGPFISFVPEGCFIAGITDSEKPEISTLAERNSATSTDIDYRSSFTSVGKPETVYSFQRR